MTNKQKEQLTSDLLDACANFIQKNPPEGFNTAYFQICLMSGRFGEVIEQLNGHGRAV